jgi:hypothetical protein
MLRPKSKVVQIRKNYVYIYIYIYFHIWMVFSGIQILIVSKSETGFL